MTVPAFAPRRRKLACAATDVDGTSRSSKVVSNSPRKGETVDAKRVQRPDDSAATRASTRQPHKRSLTGMALLKKQKTITPAALTDLLTQSASLEALDACVTQHKAAMNERHVSAALSKLVRLHDFHVARTAALPAQQLLVHRLLDMLLAPQQQQQDAAVAATAATAAASAGSARVELLDSRGLSNVLWSVVKGQQEAHGTVFSRLLERLSADGYRALYGCRARQELASIAWSVATAASRHDLGVSHSVSQSMSNSMSDSESEHGGAGGGGGSRSESAGSSGVVASGTLSRQTTESLFTAIASAWSSLSPSTADSSGKVGDMANAMWAFAKVGCLTPAFAGQLCAEMAATGLASAKPQEVANVLWACATSRGNAAAGAEVGMEPAFARQLCAHISQMRLATLKKQDLSVLLWALAKVGCLEPAFAGQLCDEVARRDLASFSLQALSNMLWACATARCLEPAFAQKVCSHILKRPDLEQLRPQELSQVLWACAASRCWEAGSGDKLCAHVTKLAGRWGGRGLKSFLSQELSTILWACGTAGHWDGELVDAVCKEVATRRDWAPRSLVSALWALGALVSACPWTLPDMQQRGAVQDALRALVRDAAASRVVGYAAVDLSQMVWALGVLGYYDPNLMDSVAKAAVATNDSEAHSSVSGGGRGSGMANAEPQAWAMVLQGFAKLRHAQPSFFYGALELMGPLMDRFTPRDWVDVLSAYATAAPLDAITVVVDALAARLVSSQRAGHRTAAAASEDSDERSTSSQSGGSDMSEEEPGGDRLLEDFTERELCSVAWSVSVSGGLVESSGSDGRRQLAAAVLNNAAERGSESFDADELAQLYQLFLEMGYSDVPLPSGCEELQEAGRDAWQRAMHRSRVGEASSSAADVCALLKRMNLDARLDETSPCGNFRSAIVVTLPPRRTPPRRAWSREGSSAGSTSDSTSSSISSIATMPDEGEREGGAGSSGSEISSGSHDSERGSSRSSVPRASSKQPSMDAAATSVSSGSDVSKQPDANASTVAAAGGPRPEVLGEGAGDARVVAVEVDGPGAFLRRAMMVRTGGVRWRHRHLAQSYGHPVVAINAFKDGWDSNSPPNEEAQRARLVQLLGL